MVNPRLLAATAVDEDTPTVGLPKTHALPAEFSPSAWQFTCSQAMAGTCASHESLGTARPPTASWDLACSQSQSSTCTSWKGACHDFSWMVESAAGVPTASRLHGFSALCCSCRKTAGHLTITLAGSQLIGAVVGLGLLLHVPGRLTTNSHNLESRRKCGQRRLALRCFQKSSWPTKSPKAIGPMAIP